MLLLIGVIIVIILACIYLKYYDGHLLMHLVGYTWLVADGTIISFPANNWIGITKKVNLIPTTTFLQLGNLRQSRTSVTASTPNGNLSIKYEDDKLNLQLGDVAGYITKYQPYSNQISLVVNSFKSQPTALQPTGTLTVTKRYNLYDVSWKQGSIEKSYTNTEVVADNFSIQFMKDNQPVAILQKTDKIYTYNSPIGIISLNINIESIQPAHKQYLTTA